MLINKESGQVLLAVVLAMVIVLTVGLSLASKSIVDIITSSEEADSQRALAAAESGVEQALNRVGDFSGGFSEIGSDYEVEIRSVAGTEFLLNNGNLVEKGEGIDIWFVEHGEEEEEGGAGRLVPNFSQGWDGTKWLSIYWGTSETPCDNAALEIIFILGSEGSPSLKRSAYDPCATRGNGFDTPVAETVSIEGEMLRHKFNLVPGSDVLLVRVVPIYTNAIMGIIAEEALPTQGYSIDSTGTFAASDKQVKRSISVFKQYGQLPIEYLNYGLFSP